MNIKNDRKIPVFRMAFKISAGWILGKKVIMTCYNVFNMLSELAFKHMVKHRHDSTVFADAFNKALNICGFNSAQESNDKIKNKMGFECNK